MVVRVKARNVPEDTAAALSDEITAAVGADPASDVIGPGEMMTLLKAQQYQQIMGCENPQCFAEVAGTAGAHVIIGGTLSKLGDAFELKLERIEIGPQAPRVALRSVRKANAPDQFGAHLKDMVKELTPKVVTPPPMLPELKLPIEMLATHQDCHWLATQYFEDAQARRKQPEKLYRARLGSEHFKFDEYDKLWKQMALKRDFYFPGVYHSCFDRDQEYKDAFTLRDDLPLVMKVNDTVGEDLTMLRRRRKLVLDIVFRVAGAKLYKMQDYDWQLCQRASKPFQPSELAPNIYIRVEAAELRDMFNNKRYPVYKQEYDDEKDENRAVKLPAPPEGGGELPEE
jgi:hypothetical protein